MSQIEIWDQFRDQMPITRKWAYFDNGAVAPLSAPARDAMSNWSTGAANNGDTDWLQWLRGAERTRQTTASLLNAAASEVALVPNTTAGISLVAEGFPWDKGDNVVIPANEFPSNAYPWLNLASRGVESRRVPIDGNCVNLNRIAEACDRRTRMISVSWIGYATGWRIDVGELVRMAHDRGALVMLDAIQGLGLFPLDVQKTGVDFVAADGHKWMLGPEGAGILYLRQEHIADLRPMCVGWNSVDHASDYSKIELRLRHSASRYEGGSNNMAGFLGLGASLDLLAGLGLSASQSPLAERVAQITELACEGLESVGAQIVSNRDEKHRSGIVAFDLPGRDLPVERKRCLEAGVVLSCRGGYLRISPHAYVNEEDVNRLVKALKI